MEMREKHQACEPKEEGILYRIGMFAAMNHVTIKTLRFYEERGILLPAYINQENGYRYYRLAQMADLHQITALKMAGFTLDEIAMMRAGANEEVVLMKKKSEMLSRIAELTRQVAILDGYLAKREGSLSVPVLVKKIPEVTVAYMTDRIKSYDRLFDLMPAMGEVMEQVNCQCAIPEYCFTNYLEPGYKDEDILVEICEAVTEAKADMIEKAKKDGLYFKTMPKIQAACAFHRGSYENFRDTYEILLNYIEENGLEICGPIREFYIDGIWNKEREEDWLTEIQIPVRKKNQE